MNVFGGMGFARIIKTFVPGLFLLIGLTGYFELLAWVLKGRPILWPWATENPAMSLALISVVAIAVGVLSNMVVFTFATDWFLRRPFLKTNADFEAKELTLMDAAKDLICSGKVASSRALPLDIEYLLFRKLPLDKIIYLQEGYWYYLEFQMNMGVALIVSSPLVVSGAFMCAVWFGAGVSIAAAVAVGAALGVLATLALLLRTARVNFARHRIKRFSMLVSALSEMQRETRSVRGRVRPAVSRHHH